MGLTANAIFAATVLITRNIRIADAFTARQAKPTTSRQPAPTQTPPTPPQHPRRPHRHARPLTAPAPAAAAANNQADATRQPGNDHPHANPPATNPKPAARHHPNRLTHPHHRPPPQPVFRPPQT